jgi:hypothetical protein
MGGAHEQSHHCAEENQGMPLKVGLQSARRRVADECFSRGHTLVRIKMPENTTRGSNA